MKIAILIGAALMGATGIAATPADAQRWGDRYDRHDRWDGPGRHHRDWRGDRGWRGDRWRGPGRGRGYGWNGNRGWRGGRDRVVCHTVRGYYGPERRCVRVNRW